MTKKTSSASAGTRKKHAKKAAKAVGDEDEHHGHGQPSTSSKTQQGKSKKLSKAQKRALPKIKQYIPPPKPPAPPIPNPLDSQGLASQLPADLVVVLRNLGKKDDVTRRKALEELKGWVTGATPAGEDDETEREIKESALLTSIPVWMHNLASMLQSPFHRSLAIQLHTDLLGIASTRSAIWETLSLSLSPGTQNRDILGSWLVAAIEEGQRAGGAGIRGWTGSTIWIDSDETSDSHGRINLKPQLSYLVQYLELSILDPPSLHDDIHPNPVQAASQSTKQPGGGKGKKAAPAAPVPEATSAEDELVAEERWTRYRVGGLEGLCWLLRQLAEQNIVLPEELSSLLRNDHLWTSLSVDAEDTLGGKQPVIRRAGYSLLDTLLSTFPSETAANLDTLAVAVLGNCWRDREQTAWQTAAGAVSNFLTRHSDAWEVAMRLQEGSSGSGTAKNKDKSATTSGAPSDIDEDDEDDDDSDDDSDGDEAKADAQNAPASTSNAFAQFLDFVSTICPTIPALTYRVLFVTVSTIPESILPLASPPSTALQTLFAHLWSPVDARLLSTFSVLGQPSAFQLFFEEAINVSSLLLGKASQTTPPATETRQWLATEQLAKRAWADGVLALGGKSARRGQPAIEHEATKLGRALAKLEATDPELSSTVMAEIREQTKQWYFPAEDRTKAIESRLPRFLPVVDALRGPDATVEWTQQIDLLVASLSTQATEELEKAVRDTSSTLPVLFGYFARVMTPGGQSLSAELRTRVETSIEASLPSLVSGKVSLPALQALLAALATHPEVNAQQLRDNVWRTTSDSSIDANARCEFVLQLLTHGGDAASLVTSGMLDSLALEAAQLALKTNADPYLKLAKRLLEKPDSLSDDTRQELLALACSSAHHSVEQLLLGQTESAPADTAAQMVLAYTSHGLSEIAHSDIYRGALVAAHHVNAFFPSVVAGSDVWTRLDSLRSTLDPESRDQLVHAICVSISDMLPNTQAITSPRDLVSAMLRILDVRRDPKIAVDLHDLISSAGHSLAEACQAYTRHPVADGLYMLDPLIYLSTARESVQAINTDFDRQGRSTLARQIEAQLALILEDRKRMSSYAQLHSILRCALLAQEALWSRESGCARGLYAPDTEAALLQSVVDDAEGALFYFMRTEDSEAASVEWHKGIVASIKGDSNPSGRDTASESSVITVKTLLQRVAVDLVRTENDVDARVLRTVLSRVLQTDGAGIAEANVWLQYAMSVARSNPVTALSIIHAVKPVMVDSDDFDKAENRLANDLTGVKPSEAATKGKALLRLLVASSPELDSASAFLPQRRAVFVLRHVETWLAADDFDDEDAELQLRLVELFSVLAPIVQSEQGGFWETIFDVLENNIADASLVDPAPTLHASLCLLLQLRELVASNKTLRATWTKQEDTMRAVMYLFSESHHFGAHGQEISAPKAMIQSAILDVLGGLGEATMAGASLSELAVLIDKSTTPAVQCAAYRIMTRVIKHETLALVLQVEASIEEAEDGHASAPIALPASLMDIVEQGRHLDWHTEVNIQDVLGQILAWMAILDHFNDASRTLTWSYLDQLKSSDLLVEGLMPMLFAMLGVSEVGAWNFPASQYTVDEFHTDLLEVEDLADLTPLGSHLYYRALVTLPSPIEKYYESIKDRQLEMSMLQFTARHYSPVIIAREFAALREPAAKATLTEEGLNVKIAQGGGSSIAGAASSEVIASYVVDEQPMEIGIRLPAEFPLKAVEIRDLRRAGVPEGKWRGWLFSVQQTITSRNGLILQALTVFKKNVSLHFEGVVECAICYSIISLQDRTLPTKPCRTCNNRFHASCLFKWFNSSHSSSCPLCRALF